MPPTASPPGTGEVEGGGAHIVLVNKTLGGDTCMQSRVDSGQQDHKK